MIEPLFLPSVAQAVLDAMYEVNMDFGKENAKLAAAALRAAADRVPDYPTSVHWLQAIADELERNHGGR